MQRSSKGLLIVESNVPYGAAIAAWLALRRQPLAELERSSRWYERPFLAWETVRRVRNPFYSMGTGFEGYYIGQCGSSDEMTERLLQLGRDMIASNDLLYNFDYNFKSRLMKALAEEALDLKALNAWSQVLGATLGRLRRMAASSPAASTFQQETYRMTNSVPPIRYTLHDHTVSQTYTLPFPGQHNARASALDPATVYPADREAAFVITTVGRLGHPLVRQYLADVSR